MSGDPQESLDLDAVRGPATPPPEAPDERTERERIAEREDSKLDQLSKMARWPEYGHVLVAEREVERLGEQVREMSVELRRLHEHVEKDGPQHAIVRQAFHDMRGNFSIAALLMTAGGLSVSVAGAINDANWKPTALVGGITTFSIGFLLSLFTLLWIRPQS